MLERLHQASRLSEEFSRSLLGWVHSGFSVHGEQTVPTENVEGGRLRVRTPPDPLELIHALTTQIPDPGQHLVRHYAWYSNRQTASASEP